MFFVNLVDNVAKKDTPRPATTVTIDFASWWKEIKTTNMGTIVALHHATTKHWRNFVADDNASVAIYQVPQGSKKCIAALEKCSYVLYVSSIGAVKREHGLYTIARVEKCTHVHHVDCEAFIPLSQTTKVYNVHLSFSRPLFNAAGVIDDKLLSLEVRNAVPRSAAEGKHLKLLKEIVASVFEDDGVLVDHEGTVFVHGDMNYCPDFCVTRYGKTVFFESKTSLFGFADYRVKAKIDLVLQKGLPIVCIYEDKYSYNFHSTRFHVVRKMEDFDRLVEKKACPLSIEEFKRAFVALL